MQHSVPDHPVIANMERTGHPDGKFQSPLLCPLCGGECETIYRIKESGEVVGCDLCIEQIDPWDI